jgi:hypothetical protein
MSRLVATRRTLVGLLVVAPALFACADPVSAPRARTATAPERRVDAGPRADATLASVTWQATARALIASHPTFSPVAAARVYALHAVAQYGGLVAADFGGGRAQFEIRRGAVAGASAQLLSSVFPDAAAALERQLVAQGAEGPGPQHQQFTRGVAIGRAWGEAMRVWGLADGITRPWDGVPLPTGAGLWTSAPNAPPAGVHLSSAQPYFLTSSSQFRPAPPPQFGTPEFDAAVAAVRQVTDARTEEQRAIANFWNQGGGTPSTAGYWLAQASDLIVAAGLDEREAAHVFALTSSAIVDASIGCFDAKYHYMLIRPSQADPLITRPLGLPGFPYGLPNHPSYPSGHSCLSAAAVTVLGAYFPAHRADLEAQMQEAGMSRIYGGLHYFFDVAAGQDLGRDVATWAMAYDRDYGLLSAVLQP